MTSDSHAARFYRPELDVLRFMAFFLVFVAHVVPEEPAIWVKRGLPHPLAVLIGGIGSAGAYGVDLFFAISSFLLTSLMLREHSATGTVDVRLFYVRRVLRIWPLYFVFLLLITPALRWVLPAEHLSLAYVLAFLLFSGNWICAVRGYPPSVASPLWSVSLEEQFYLVWPLLMKRYISKLTLIAVSLLVVAFATRAYLVYQGAVHPAVWCNTLARLDPIALGAILAVRQFHAPTVMSGLQSKAALIIGSLLLLAAGCFGSRDGAGALVTYPAVALASVLIIFGSLAPQAARPKGVIKRSLVYLGTISYGLYVFHAACIALIQPHSAGVSVLRYAIGTLAAFAATVIVAALSYQYLEKPFLLLKERFTIVPSRPA